jgi:hypothetical protein
MRCFLDGGTRQLWTTSSHRDSRRAQRDVAAMLLLVDDLGVPLVRPG